MCALLSASPFAYACCMYIFLLPEPPEFKKRALPSVDMGVFPWTKGRGHTRGVHLATRSPFRTVGLRLWLRLPSQLFTPARIKPPSLFSVSHAQPAGAKLPHCWEPLQGFDPSAIVASFVIDADKEPETQVHVCSSFLLGTVLSASLSLLPFWSRPEALGPPQLGLWVVVTALHGCWKLRFSEGEVHDLNHETSVQLCLSVS